MKTHKGYLKLETIPGLVVIDAVCKCSIATCSLALVYRISIAKYACFNFLLGNFSYVIYNMN